MTYPDRQVADLLNEDFVSVQVDLEKAGRLADQFQVIWTPNLNFIGSRGKRIYHLEGWLPPSDFAAMLGIVRGHYHLAGKKFADAAPHFKGVFDRSPHSQFAPEALYYRGVSRYLDSHEVDKLKEDWTTLQRFYPQSAWSMRANIL